MLGLLSLCDAWAKRTPQKCLPLRCTGRLMRQTSCSAEEAVQRVLRKHDVLLIADEIYDEFAFRGMTEPTPRDPSRRATPSAARYPGADE